MPLNPFFLQGSAGEQSLIQDLINEQLQIYGVEVYYLPRKIFQIDDIIREISSSKFDDAFLIEAYVNNYDGYNPGSDIMTKFGLQLKNEVSLTISRERFEEFISPFLEGITSGISEERIAEYTFKDLVSRPKEGDLIYFPLGERLFEIKRVESEKPFYQLGKNYVYELQCELYEYENEIIDTTINEVDNTIEDEGYITTLILSRESTNASATAIVGGKGMVGSIDLIQDGGGYTSAPTVTISSPDDVRQTAKAVAITTTSGGVTSIKEIIITNCGSGYTSSNPPSVTITGGGGSGSVATATIVDNGISKLVVNNSGSGYYGGMSVAIDPPSTVEVEPVITDGRLTSFNIKNTGFGYTEAPSVSISTSPNTGQGNFVYGEFVVGQSSGTRALVRDFRTTDPAFVDEIPITRLRVAINSGKFSAGERVIGEDSLASYIVEKYEDDDYDNDYDSNLEIETEAISIIDFTESNPFGGY